MRAAVSAESSPRIATEVTGEKSRYDIVLRVGGVS